jgi:hypothetical protein
VINVSNDRLSNQGRLYMETTERPNMLSVTNLVISSQGTHEITRAVEILLEPGSVAELRVPNSTRGTLSGYFTDFQKLAEHAAVSSGKAPGIYITLNPVRPELLARAENRIKEYAKQSTSDVDIVRRRWLPIDFDPVRPSGISSTAEEHLAALRRARECRDWLTIHGWPEPLLADSGNGAHLLYSVDLPNDSITRDVIKAVLQVLSFHFSDEIVDVDLTTFNAARIWKVYGTQAAKGDSTPDRPHRVAALLEIPEKIIVVNTELLRTLVGQQPKPLVGNCRDDTKFDVAGWIAEHNLPITGHGEWMGGQKWILNPCPWNPEHRNRSAYIVQFPNGAIAAGCHHDSCAKNNWEALRNLVDPNWKNGKLQQDSTDYRSTPSGLVWFKETKEGSIPVQLTNFTARIAGEVAHDDGADMHLSLEIEAAQNNRTFRFNVPAPQFASMNWAMEKLGAGAVIFPGSSIRDHARVAMQLLSGDVPRRTIFGHAGWRKIDGEWMYLHGGGAVGANGNLQRVEVALPAALGAFLLPDARGGQELIDCWHASISVLDVAEDAISVVLFLAIWRSVLATSDFSVHLAGATGVFKTELAALAMQHFGPNFNSRHLPASWSSTGNSLEGLAFIMKDALLVVDDFCPTGSTADVQRYHREADRILRAQRNNAGRHRMRSDASLRPSKPPRGLILSTGEDSPRGQSLRAGMLILEIGPGDVNQKRLTQAQADASNGNYAKSMAGFLTWLAGRYEPMRESLRSRLAELRRQATASTSHRRTPEIVAGLMFGLDLFLEFGREIGATTEVDAAQIRQRCWVALGEVAEAQTAHLQVNEPTRRFLELLGAAITAGRAHVAGPDGLVPENPAAWGWRAVGSGVLSEHRPQGNGVGWVDGDSLYLDLDCSVAATQNMARDLGDSIVVAPRTLAKRLKEKGVLKETSDSRQTTKVRRVLGGRRREVLHLAADALGNLSSFGVGDDHIEPSDVDVVPHADDVLIANPTTQPTTGRYDEREGSGELVGLVGSVEDNPPHDPLALSTSDALDIHGGHSAIGVTTTGDLEDVSGEEIL